MVTSADTSKRTMTLLEFTQLLAMMEDATDAVLGSSAASASASAGSASASIPSASPESPFFQLR